jgi:hypothetical protein
MEIQGQTVDERFNWLKNILSSGSYTVTFTKVDGSMRSMPCTLQSQYIEGSRSGENKRSRSLDTISVWALDVNAWRSFKVMNIANIEPYQPTTWIVSLEEDPETGDLIMPLPEELLKSQGWNIGDTLVWDLDESSGTATLTKDHKQIEKL